MAVLKSPFSTLCFAASLGGKTEYWLRHLSKLVIFDPRPTHIHCFGHLNLKQFDRLKDIWGEDFVDVNHVSDIPGFDFRPGSFVLVDEINSSIVGLKKQARETLLDSIRVLYNQRVHHSNLYLACLCQEVVTTDCYSFLGITQSVTVSTLNYGKSMELIGHLKQRPSVVRRFAAAMEMLQNVPEFIIFYHQQPADAQVHHKYMWSCLGHYPHFSLAFGDKHRQSSGALSLDRSHAVAMSSESAQAAFDDIRAQPVPADLAGKVFVYAPLESIVPVEEPAAEDEEEQAQSALNQRVLETFSHVCSAGEFTVFKKFWYYLRKCPFIAIDDDGAVLYYRNNTVNCLSFIRECSKKTPNHAFGGTKPRKINQVLRESVPFAAQLLRDKQFPSHLISNALLQKLAMRYNQQK
jgi:hypothetical protein